MTATVTGLRLRTHQDTPASDSEVETMAYSFHRAGITAAKLLRLRDTELSQRIAVVLRQMQAPPS